MVAQAACILRSFHLLLGRRLIECGSDDQDNARRLYEAPLVVVSHNTAEDPCLNYANATALKLWECSMETLLGMPSRRTAEAVHRDERARMLERTSRDGFIDDYQGIRISTSGRRFLIRKAIVWNLTTPAGGYCGQAATFDAWEFLDE